MRTLVHLSDLHFGRIDAAVLEPLARFHRYVHAEPFPTHVDDTLAVIGVNTARSLVFKGGAKWIGGTARAPAGISWLLENKGAKPVRALTVEHR